METGTALPSDLRGTVMPSMLIGVTSSFNNAGVGLAAEEEDRLAGAKPDSSASILELMLSSDDRFLFSAA